MITTGSPAASLLATSGNEPIDLGPPFGGRQGTRLKMSLADFATSFTLSSALPGRLFCCAEFCGGGLAWSTAATLPLVEVCGAWAPSVFAPSDFTPSDLAP